MKGKTLLLFGPGEHFGFALAKQFGKEGFHIALVARSEEPLVELCHKLRKEGISCSFARADVCNKEEVASALEELVQPTPSVSALIFNIKAGVRGNGLDLPPEALTSALATNVSGALAAIQATLPLFAPGASIILTGGGYKDKPDPEKLALSVSKGALHTLFLALMRPLKERGITIKTVIIDGAVRKEGPLFPDAVSRAFWDVYQSADTVEFTIKH